MLQLPSPEAREPYVALLETIAHQQLAGAAARAIWARVIALFENSILCPRRLADMTEEHPAQRRPISQQGSGHARYLRSGKCR